MSAAMPKDLAQEVAFWLTVALVSIAASVLAKVVAARWNNEALHQFAAAT